MSAKTEQDSDDSAESLFQKGSKGGYLRIMEYEPQTLSFRPDGQPMGYPGPVYSTGPTGWPAAKNQYA
jgi:hypothetical protein